MMKSIFENKLVFENIVFHNIINEKEFETSKVIHFVKCTFKMILIFERINSYQLTFEDCIFEDNIKISNSNYTIFKISNCTIEGNFELHSNSSDEFDIYSTKALSIGINGNYGQIEFSDCEITNITFAEANDFSRYKTSRVFFSFDNKIKRLDFNCSNFNSEIIFNGGQFDSVFFDGEFKKKIEFKNQISINTLSFESSLFDKRIDIRDGFFEFIYFHRSSFKGLIYANDFNQFDKNSRKLEVKNISLHSSNFEKDVVFEISKINNFSCSNSNFNEILNLNNYNDRKEGDIVNIDFRGVIQGNIIIERIYTDIKVDGINFGNIFIKNADIFTFHACDFQNNGLISFSEIRSGNYFVVDNSTTGKMNFLNANINVFKEIIIVNSNIDGANFLIYPNKITSRSRNKLAGYGITNYKQNNLNLKNVYNQLKRIAKKNGDIDISSRFESLEHKKLLFSKKCGFDSILLFLNWVSNDNGRSWSRGVLFTLIVAFIFFRIYLYNLNVSFNFKECYTEYILFITSFPKLELDGYSELNDNWKIKLVIWLSRIFISYGIYQTIAAFRKYGKS